MKLYALPVILCALVGFVLPVNGGPLTPPTGPIGPTMKPLDEIQPCTSINSLPGDPTAMHVIDQGGCYYQTADIQCEPPKSCIRIAALPPKTAVSINGNGFVMRGVAGSLHGIDASNAGRIHLRLVTIIIIGMGGKGVAFNTGAAGPGGGGTFAVTPADEGMYDVSGGNLIEDCAGGGIEVTGVDVANVSGVRVNGAGGAGIDIQPFMAARVSSSMVQGCNGDGFSIRPPASGDWPSIIEHTFNISEGNTGDGIYVRLPSGVGTSTLTVERCTGSANGRRGLGIEGGSATGTVAITVTDCIWARDLDHEVQVILNAQTAAAAGGGSAGATSTGGTAGPTPPAGGNASVTIRRTKAIGGGAGGIVIEANGADKAFAIDVDSCAMVGNAGPGYKSSGTSDKIYETIFDSDSINNGQQGFYITGSSSEPPKNATKFVRCGAEANRGGPGYQVDRPMKETSFSSSKSIANTGAGCAVTGETDLLNFQNFSAQNNAGAGIKASSDQGPVHIFTDHVESVGNGEDGISIAGPSAGPGGIAKLQSVVVAKNTEHGLCILNVDNAEIRETTAEANGLEGVLIAGLRKYGLLNGILANGNGQNGINLGGTWAGYSPNIYCLYSVAAGNTLNGIRTVYPATFQWVQTYGNLIDNMQVDIAPPPPPLAASAGPGLDRASGIQTRNAGSLNDTNPVLALTGPSAPADAPQTTRRMNATAPQPPRSPGGSAAGPGPPVPAQQGLVVISECAAQRAGRHGVNIISAPNGLMRFTWCPDNASAGIRLGTGATNFRIEDNLANTNSIGFDIQGTGNLITNNSAIGNSVADYDIGPNNAAGPIVGPSDVATNNSPNANFGGSP